jgi:two-component system, chemotaxis family, sensor kinase Cph1
MKIKDIVNRDIVNLSNCDQEPIHIPGSIQPFGFLLAFGDDLNIEFCSGNIGLFTDHSHESILKKHAG